MLKISSKSSVMLSTALSAVLFAVCVVGFFLMPSFVETLIKIRNLIYMIPISPKGEILVLSLAYSALICVTTADVLLFLLLKKVRQSKVFTTGSIALVRGVSWCCILLGVVFLCIGFYFWMALIVAFLAAFLGLCLRVVKNVLEEAADIKSENDLTV